MDDGGYSRTLGIWQFFSGYSAERQDSRSRIETGQRTLVYAHAYRDASDEDEHSPINRIRAFGKTFASQADNYRMLVLLTNFQIADEALESVADAVGSSESVTITHDAASFVQSGLINPCVSTGIPKVFAIGEDGVIDWIGDPDEFPEILVTIQDGRFDRQEAHRNYESHVAEARVGFDANDHFSEALKVKNHDLAVAVAIERLDAQPVNHSWLGSKYEALLRADRHSDLNPVLLELSKKHLEDADWLAETAYAAAEGVAGNDRVLALDFAERATEITGKTSKR